MFFWRRCNSHIICPDKHTDVLILRITGQLTLPNKTKAAEQTNRETKKYITQPSTKTALFYTGGSGTNGLTDRMTSYDFRPLTHRASSARSMPEMESTNANPDVPEEGAMLSRSHETYMRCT